MALAKKPMQGGNAMQVQPYLFFDGRCEEALHFYQEKLGADVTMFVRFKDLPESEADVIPPGGENKVMHARMRIGETAVMASDGLCRDKPRFEGFSLSVTAATPADAEFMFAALSDGGTVQMPLSKTFFSPRYGLVTDRFGVSWMVYVEP
jgi:PhnB protein